MSWLGITAIAFAGVWIGSGVALAAIIFWKDGLPDFDTYDGPAIAWGETFGTLMLCVVGAPVWYLIAIQEWSSSRISSRERL